MRNKKLKSIVVFVLILLSGVHPMKAQEKTDTIYLFRFVPEKDMFYVPWNGNDKELARLESCVDRYRTEILSGKLPLRVDGYCNSLSGRKENLNVAYLRANRVKSELITRKQLTEECFITRNHASEGDFVTVSLKVPKTPAPQPTVSATTDTASPETVINNKEEKPETEATKKPYKESQTATVPASKSVAADRYHFALRANLLRWATLTPDLGIEWRIHPSWSIMVNGSWTSWSWNNKDRRYALWEVSPEVRHYIGKEKRGYVGVMFKAGEFNYKLSAIGKQGDLMGGGLTGGYQLKLNNAFSIDFNLGIGYLKADYEKYEVIDGVRVRRGNETKNWWGPVNAGVTLMWKLF